MTPLGEAALKLAAKGLRVFPCKERGKEPAIYDNLRRATTDENTIYGWWRSRDFNIGIATGPGSGIWVLDIDGEDGEALLHKLETEFSTLPATVEVITGAGRHLYFRWCKATPIRDSQDNPALPGIDTRGDGGYVLAPPSMHPSGRRYAWSVDTASAIADAPAWLITVLQSRRNRGEGSRPAEYWRSFIDEDVDGSRRNPAITRLYGLLIRRWIDPVMALSLVRMFNTLHCKPPLDDAEVVRIANDIARREARRD
jgi:hypothetical protein